MAKRPKVFIIAGPNGSGKTTFASKFLPKYADCPLFINADTIARGLSGFSPDAVALRAGRILLEQIENYASRNADFAFETTLSGTNYLSRLKGLKERGYVVPLPALDSWMLFDNSGDTPREIAEEKQSELKIYNRDLYEKILKLAEEK